MQPLLPEKLSGNGTGATNPAQATDTGLSGRLHATGVFSTTCQWRRPSSDAQGFAIPLGGAFR
tara:strand:- start:1122 stop:1310 length:189 start_codon:yes stop_codon:yes gene_type:complete